MPIKTDMLLFKSFLPLYLSRALGFDLHILGFCVLLILEQSGCSTGSVLAEGKDRLVARFKGNFSVFTWLSSMSNPSMPRPPLLFPLPRHKGHSPMVLCSGSLSVSLNLSLSLLPSFSLTFSFGDFYDGWKRCTVLRKRR